MTGRWRTRVVCSVAFFVVLYVVLRLLDFEPRPGGLLLLTALGAATAWLVVDVLVDLGPTWTVQIDAPAMPPRLDPQLSTAVRVLEHHLTGDETDGALRDRLARLADVRLAQRHGLRRDHPGARERLGPELTAVLDGPPRRLSVGEIDRHIRRLEEL